MTFSYGFLFIFMYVRTSPRTEIMPQLKRKITILEKMSTQVDRPAEFWNRMIEDFIKLAAIFRASDISGDESK